MTDRGNIEHLAIVVAGIVDREAKARGISALEVCSALGAAAGAVVGVNTAAAFDPMMLAIMQNGFETTVGAARKAKGTV